jgi:hypothetical protein
MGDADKQRAKTYRERDERILLGLRSAVDAERAQAMDLLADTLRWPLAQVLRKIAKRSTSEAFEFILDGNFCVDEAAYGQVWQETIKCLCENIEKKNFEFKGNLLGYLATIAWRVTDRLWRKERRHHQSASLEKIAVRPPDALEESEELENLLDHIEQFHNTLNANDQLALRIGMRLMTGDDSSSTSMKVIAAKIRFSGAWGGSNETILRRYARLTTQLREFLKDRGHDV